MAHNDSGSSSLKRVSRKKRDRTSGRRYCDRSGSFATRLRWRWTLRSGSWTQEEATTLAEEGVNHYNHNIETSRRFFPEVVATHSFKDRVHTLEVAKAAGMDLCAGVILGMGVSPTDRVDAAVALQEIGISSFPVNVLNPIPGTPLGNRFGDSPAITTEELLATIAVYRLLHPSATVRLTGGREVMLDVDEQPVHFAPVLTAY